MRANPAFVNQPKQFWAEIRTIGELAGYTSRRQVKIPLLEDIARAYSKSGLESRHLLSAAGEPTPHGERIASYLKFRAETLNQRVEPLLMDADEARKAFNKLKKKYRPSCPLPMNKQKGDKKTPAYLTGMVNMIVEANSQGAPVTYDSRQLTTIIRNGAPLRTFARRIDGAFPGPVNPIGVWEIKEYYYTTTFGSRVADGVYEILLDGMEIQELRENEKIEVEHLLIVDSRYTWWECGKSYLCRIMDMLHMGYVDHVLFGKEVIDELPGIIRGWAERYKLQPR